MNTLKQILTIAVLSTSIISPIACDSTPPVSPAPTEVICDKTHSGLLEYACIMGLFLVSAYILQKIVPPLPPEKKDEKTESAMLPVVEAPIQTIAPVAAATTIESVQPVELIAAPANTMEDLIEQDEIRTIEILDTIEEIEAHVSEQPQYHFQD